MTSEVSRKALLRNPEGAILPLSEAGRTSRDGHNETCKPYNPARLLPMRWLAVLLLAALASCTSKEGFGLGAIDVLSAGVVNDPANKTLRFDLLRFGLGKFCQEMQKRGVPLKLADGQPATGRFFATSCQSQIFEDERQSLVVRFAGHGYTWSQVTGRIGFETDGLVEYAPDFRMHDGAMYIYFRPQNVSDSRFRTTLVESTLARAAGGLTGVNPNKLGLQIMNAQLKRGFTVIRYGGAGQMDFAMGLLPEGQRPFRPFHRQQVTHELLDNDRTEIHAGQQDYVGGFEIEDEDEALYLTLRLEGTPAVDVLIVPKAAGSGMLSRYTTTGGPALVQGVPLSEPLLAGQPWQRYVALPPGGYYLVIDHSAYLGQVAPAQTVLDNSPARVDYLIQRGSRP